MPLGSVFRQTFTRGYFKVSKVTFFFDFNEKFEITSAQKSAGLRTTKTYEYNYKLLQLLIRQTLANRVAV